MEVILLAKRKIAQFSIQQIFEPVEVHVGILGIGPPLDYQNVASSL
jgi:hypothetical protein